jgi:hypothetical protein
VSDSEAPRVYCDFNDGDDKSGYWILYYKSRPLAEQIDELGLKEGSEVILFQDKDDFQVPAILQRGRTFWGEGGEAWLALPDWSRRVDLS